MSGLAERLIDEGLRMARHPLIVFRSGASGRRPVVFGGPDVADVVGAIVGGDIPPGERAARAVDLLNLSLHQVDAAMACYAVFTAEVDADLQERADVADEAHAAWLRQQEALRR